MLKYPYLMLALTFSTSVFANLPMYSDLLRLKKAYPEFITAVTEDHIVWIDGTIMSAKDRYSPGPRDPLTNPSLLDQVQGIQYEIGIPADLASYAPQGDPGRIRYEPFFTKMYGDNENAVRNNLVTIYWMAGVFGSTYPLDVTQINRVDQKLLKISNKLEQLVQIHPEYIPYLENIGGTFIWRTIANTNRLSPHSFGMTIDINGVLSDYWQWDLDKTKQPIHESTPLMYRNQIPWEIVPIFEEQGFIWGGKWYHYDSMHFEYRPELLVPLEKN